MSYYRGDYRGGYYKGDPFIGGLIGSAARALGAGKLVAKGAKWLGQRISGSSVKKATAVVAGAAAAPILTAAAGAMIPRTGTTMPVQIGPLGIDPGSMLPGGEPGWTWGRKKYRRMNALNPKALKRALRRAEGFEKFAKQTMNALYKTSDGRKVKKFKRTTSKRS